MATIEKFLLVGTQASYDALSSKSADKLYFCSDTLNIYKGADLYTDGIRKVSAKPTTPAVGKLYYISGTDTLEMYDGSAWTTVKPAVTKTVDTNSTDSQIPTAKAVYDYVSGAIADITGSGTVVTGIAAATTSGAVTVTKGDGSTADVTVPNVVTDPTYDASTRTITLPIAGKDSLVIALGKDIFLDTTKDNKYNAETKNIELYLNDGTKIEIPASGLIDVYTGDTTSTTATVSVSDGNVISVAVKLSTDSNNALTVDSKNGGLLLDLSSYATTKYVDDEVKAVSDKVDTTNENVTANKNAIDKLNGDKTTAGSVAYQIAASETTEKGVTDALDERITALENALGFGTF